MDFSYCSETCLTSVADFPDPSELLSKSNPSSVVKAADTSCSAGCIDQEGSTECQKGGRYVSVLQQQRKI